MANLKRITLRDYRKLERLGKVNRRDTLVDITVEFNNTNSVAERTLQFHLHKNGFKRRVKGKKIDDNRSE